MTISKQGFLSIDMQEVALNYQSKHSELFELYNSINETLYEYAPKLPIRSETEIQDSLLLSIFTRCISTYSSIKILAERELFADSFTLCRTLLEATVYISYISLNPDNAVKYVLLENHEALKLARRARDSSNRLATISVNRQELLSRIEELNHTIEELTPSHKSTKPLTLEIAALQSELTELYDYTYSILCKDTHITIQSLEKFCERNNDGEITKINIFPTDKGQIIQALGTSINLMVMILNKLEEHFKISFPNQGQIQVRINRLSQ